MKAILQGKFRIYPETALKFSPLCTADGKTAAPPFRPLYEKNITDKFRMTGAPNAVQLNTLFPEQTVAVSIPEA